MFFFNRRLQSFAIQFARFKRLKHPIGQDDDENPVSSTLQTQCSVFVLESRQMSIQVSGIRCQEENVEDRKSFACKLLHGG